MKELYRGLSLDKKLSLSHVTVPEYVSDSEESNLSRKDSDGINNNFINFP